MAAALIYWVIVALWLTILGTIIFFYVRNPHTFGTTRLLLAVLAVDAFRNILENIYFGLYFGSVYEVLPSQLAAVMGHPVLLILPKFLNVAAGSVVLCLCCGDGCRSPSPSAVRRSSVPAIWKRWPPWIS